MSNPLNPDPHNDPIDQQRFFRVTQEDSTIAALRSQVESQEKRIAELAETNLNNIAKLLTTEVERDALQAKLEASQRTHTESFIESQIERDALRDRVVELEARADRDDTQAKVAQLEEFLAESKARVAKLEETLRWYANRKNYTLYDPDDEVAVFIDHGNRARDVLGPAQFPVDATKHS